MLNTHVIEQYHHSSRHHHRQTDVLTALGNVVLLRVRTKFISFCLTSPAERFVTQLSSWMWSAHAQYVGIVFCNDDDKEHFRTYLTMCLGTKSLNFAE